MEGLVAALAAFGLVFLAELGDRTQFVLFALATHYRRIPLFLGAGLAFLLQTLLAVVIGDRLGAWLPTQLVLLVGAVIFLLLGAFTLHSAIALQEQEEEAPRAPKTRGAFLSAFLFVIIAEFGDKTQIVAAALTATSGAPVATFIGAWLALLASAALALLLGGLVARYLRARTVRLIAAAAFLLAGVLMAVFAF